MSDSRDSKQCGDAERKEKLGEGKGHLRPARCKDPITMPASGCPHEHRCEKTPAPARPTMRSPWLTSELSTAAGHKSDVVPEAYQRQEVRVVPKFLLTWLIFERHPAQILETGLEMRQA